MKRLLSNSLAFHVMAAVLLATMVALASFGATLLLLDKRSSVVSLDDRLATLAEVTGQNSTAALVFNDRQAAREMLQALHNDSSIVAGCLYDTAGALFAEYNRNAAADTCPHQKNGLLQSDRHFRRVQLHVFRSAELVGTIGVISDISAVRERQRRMVLLAGLLAFVSLLIGATAGVLLQLRITRPVFDLAHAMRRIGDSEDFSIRVQTAGSDEMKQLARGFNRMAFELQRRDHRTRQAEATLHEQARRDSLTGLSNRRAFLERISDALIHARDEQQQLALLYLDLDGFKLVNDSLGHTAGDELLRRVAVRLASNLRVSDTLARVGGDEFTVILPGLKVREDAGRIAELLLLCLREAFSIDGHEITVGCSIGISVWTGGPTDGDDLLKQADSAMYAAKRSGRNKAVYFSAELGVMARERLTLENELRHALARNEIYLEYQPVFDVRTGALKRFEALARWKHPRLGEVPPDKFISIAEECGLIHNLGAYLMESACREAARWRADDSLASVNLAVNVSAVQFNSEAIVPQIADILARTGLPAEALQIELTETVMLGSLKQCASRMNRLRDLGVTIAIDDFGTGYSCLVYLPDLPAEVIKIDRGFLRDLQAGADAAGILGPIIDLAHSLRISVVVEGIESEAQLALVRSLGADEVQGFFLGRPGAIAHLVNSDAGTKKELVSVP